MYGWKALSLTFPEQFRIENQLNIMKVMTKNVYVPCFYSFDTCIALQVILFNSFDIAWNIILWPFWFVNSKKEATVFFYVHTD